MQRRKKAPKVVHEDGSISLNKFISASGFCSRREADKYIETSRVTINNETAATGNRVYPGDKVEVDGEPLQKTGKTVYIVYHKPKGVTSTTDPADKTNIVAAIGHPQRIFPIGRLDKDSEGLIFLTNNGDIVNKILRAGNSHDKEYIVSTDPAPTPEFLRKLAGGVRLIPEGKTLPCKTVMGAKNSFKVTLVQGFNRQIRRMCNALDHRVLHLKRVRVMNVSLGTLPVGSWRYLTPEEVTTLEAAVNESDNAQKASQVKVPRVERVERPVAAPVDKPKTEAVPVEKKRTGSRPAPLSEVEKKRKKKTFQSYREKGRQR